jgi:hypothetical protein
MPKRNRRLRKAQTRTQQEAGCKNPGKANAMLFLLKRSLQEFNDFRWRHVAPHIQGSIPAVDTAENEQFRTALTKALPASDWSTDHILIWRLCYTVPPSTEEQYPLRSWIERRLSLVTWHKEFMKIFTGCPGAPEGDLPAVSSDQRVEKVSRVLSFGAGY